MSKPTLDCRNSPDTPLNIAGNTGGITELIINLQPSHQLWRAQCMVHVALAVTISCALLPIIPEQPSWILLWLLMISGLWISGLICRKALHQLPHTLRLSEHSSLLENKRTQYKLALCDDALVWSQLVVLRYRDVQSRRRINLVILSDSTSADEHRRLRVWLRTRPTIKK